MAHKRRRELVALDVTTARLYGAVITLLRYLPRSARWPLGKGLNLEYEEGRCTDGAAKMLVDIHPVGWPDGNFIRARLEMSGEGWTFIEGSLHLSGLEIENLRFRTLEWGEADGMILIRSTGETLRPDDFPRLARR